MSGGAAAATATGRYRWQWYQSAQAVSVEVFVKGTKGKEGAATLTKDAPREVELTVQDGHGDGPYVLRLGPLCGDVVPGEATVEQLSTKVELKLRKRESGVQWDDLLDVQSSSDKAAGSASVSSSAPYQQQQQQQEGPTGSSKQSEKKSPQDWAKLEAELAEIEKNEKPEGEAALQALFKDIYAKADEDTQRAMMKSFQESNGTVLSTNWNEVGKKKVAIQPPDGMEVKQYEH